MSDGVSFSRETQEEGYPKESINMELETLYQMNNRKDGDGISVVSSTDTNHNKKHVKLHEMGEQLEIAENRCNTLKTQLDAMKKIYNSVQENTHDSSRPVQKHIKRSSSSKVKNIILSSTAKLIRSGSRCIEDSSGDCKPDDKPDQYALSSRLLRQNSIAIGTDNTDEAVNTINNILNGITQSVNRLSELHATMDDKRPLTPFAGKRVQDAATEKSIEFDERATGVDMVKVVAKNHQSTTTLERPLTRKGSNTTNNSQVKEKKQRKRSQSRSSASAAQKNSTNDIILSHKVSSKSSKSSTVKSTAKHGQKRIKLASNEDALPEPASPSTTALRNKKSIKRLKQTSRCRTSDVTKTKAGRDKNLVELYHNVAAKAGSDSEDSQHNQQNRSPTDSIPPIVVECNSQSGEQDTERLSPIAENGFCEPQGGNRDPNSCRMIYNDYAQPNHVYQSRSYQLPTIASKLKQVAKSYIHQFNFRTIPFCVATSTSPSHNIGVNIQQVMNILKTRQSFNGISPTLAHNIGIAAEKLHTTPYSEIMSSLSSKIVYGKSQCPLRQNVNYQQMQEMAKDVLEEQYDTEVATYMDPNQINASQNTENDVSENTVWSVDPTKSNCTCINPSGTGFAPVLNRYRFSSSISTNRDMRRGSKMFPRTHQHVALNKNSNNRTMQNCGDEDKQNANIIKEKNLKCVLTNLHDEFDGMNKNYESLTKRINTGELFGDKEAVATLEHLEKQLTDKEEEIKIVMALYKEVVALKNQVRDLKQKASQASMYIQQQLQQQQHQQTSQMFSQQPGQVNQYHQQPAPFIGYPQAYYQTPSRRVSNRIRDNRECKDPMAALHLTKLLKQIQTYQEFYKSGR